MAAKHPWRKSSWSLACFILSLFHAKLLSTLCSQLYRGRNKAADSAVLGFGDFIKVIIVNSLNFGNCQ